MPTFVHRSRLDTPAAAVFDWHARPGALERLLPPWQHVEVVERRGGLADGRVVLAIGRPPLRIQWTAQHTGCEPGREFRDVQVSGPFARWEHTHRFAPAGEGSSTLEDEIDWALPGAPLGPLLGDGAVRRMLTRSFRFRHERTAADLARHAAVAARGAQRIAVSGASGLVGRSLVAFLESGGHTVHRLVRRAPRPGTTDISWDPAAGRLDASALEDLDVVVHLAGESIASGRWTPARQAAIRDSRVRGTELIASTLARLARPPRVLLAASAIGYYGAHDNEPLDERSPPGIGFLADVCRAWEAATQPAAAASIRVVNLRFGIVLSAAGGALARMLPPFRFGAGGVVGSGRQVMSWVALDDVVGAIHHLAFADAVHGPVNIVAPDEATNAEFTRTLGHVLRRPTLLPLPAAAVQLLFGEMGEALLLEGARVEPWRLGEAGFQFLYPELEGALRMELGALET